MFNPVTLLCYMHVGDSSVTGVMSSCVVSKILK
jgi:hypothetical protein